MVVASVVITGPEVVLLADLPLVNGSQAHRHAQKFGSGQRHGSCVI